MNENTQLVPYSVTDKWLELTGGEEMIKEASQLPEDKLILLVGQFIPFLEQVVNLEDMFNGLEVTEEDDKAGMKRAREARLAFRKARTECEKIRKEEKQWANIVGRTIDYMGRTVRSRCEHWENHYKELETFAERMEAERKEALKLKRETLLSPYVEELDGWNLADMSEDAFNKLLSVSKAQHQQEVAEREKRAQEERERMEAERLEQERLRAENKRLQAELKAKEEAVESTAKPLSSEASDVEKLRVFYQQLHAIEIPELENNDWTVSLLTKMGDLLQAVQNYGQAIKATEEVS